MEKEKFKTWLNEIIKEKKSPHEIALGFAIGLLIGISPLRLIGIPLCVIIILLIKKINKIATFVGLALINPWTMPLVLKLVLWTSNIVTGAKIKVNIATFSRTDIFHMIKPLLIGNLILAIIAAIISYVIVYFIFKKIKSHNDKKNKRKDKKD